MAPVPDPTAPPTTDPWAELSNFFASTEGGRANGRMQQAFLDLQRGQLGNQQFGQTSQNATSAGALANQQFGQQSTNAKNQADFQMDAPGKLAGQSVRGDILANAQDANVQAPPGVPMGTVTGGLRPSMFSSSTRQLGGNMARKALTDQMAGPKIDFPTAPALPSYPTAPGLPAMPEAGALDTGLNIGTGVTGGISALEKLLAALGVGGAGGGSGSGGKSPLGAGGDLGPIGDLIKKLFGGGSNPGPGFIGPNENQGPLPIGNPYNPGENPSGLVGGPDTGNGPQGMTPEELAALEAYIGGGQGENIWDGVDPRNDPQQIWEGDSF